MRTRKIHTIKKPLTVDVSVPGSKSITNRALLIAALSRNTVTLENPLDSDDTMAMINCLQSLGIRIKKTSNSVTVDGNLCSIEDKIYVLNAELSGTTLRFLLPVLCVIPGEKILKGKEGLNRRPVKDLVNALTKIGASITYLEKEGYPPLLIKQKALKEKKFAIKGSVSSQYLSALLMMLPIINGGKITVERGLVSKSYVDLTIQTMNNFGISVENDEYKTFSVEKNQRYGRIKPFEVEGDVSSACYFAALAALTKSSVKIHNVNAKSLQGDRMFLKILKDMGNEITEHNGSITVTGKQIRSVTVDMESCPDQVQTLAVLAAFAKGKTIVTGIQTLSAKETDRVLAVQTELKKMGIKTLSTKKTLTIFGGNPKGVEIDTYGDHRMAMSFALAGAKTSGVTIKNPEVVAKTFPDFWRNLEKIGV